MMRNILFSLFMLAVCFVSYAQQAYSTLECELATKEPSVLPEYLARTDNNRDTVACVVVRTELGDLAFSGDILKPIQKSVNDDGYEYIVSMIKGSRNLTIRSNKYYEGKVTFPRPLKSNELWYVDVEGIDAPDVHIAEIDDSNNTMKVNIVAEPFVNLYVDEELVSPDGNADTSQFPYVYSLDLEEGKHYISSKYGNEEYPVVLKLKKNGQEVKARMGGEVIAKNAGGFTVYPIDGPDPHYMNEGGKHTYKFEGLLGTYRMIGHPSAIRNTEVVKDFRMDQRSKKVFRLDEMVTYAFLMFHGSVQQPWGLSVGWCKNFGWCFSFNTDSKHKIKTSYGDSYFWEDDTKNGGKDKTVKWTATTISTGPLIRLWHKWYLKVEGGLVHYLRTSEPHVLTADYEYKNALAVDAEFMWRFKALMLGAGYQRQFVKSAFNPNIEAQVSFSAGFAF